MKLWKLDDQGEAVPETDMVAWGYAWEDAGGRKRIAQQVVPGGFLSTVFYGLNSKPFETMFFPDDKDRECEVIERYETRAEAVAGHARHLKTFGTVE